jgi:hypothetical protein
VKTQQNGKRARVLGSALAAWANTGPAEPATARLVIRQPPDWTYVRTVGLTAGQTSRILRLLRDDLAHRERPERALDAYLDQMRAAGRTRLRADDLAAAAHRIGQTTAWLAARLTHLADQGHIRETWRPGTYRI